MPEDEYITADAAAEILGVSPRQAMRYGATDDIRRVEEGRKFFYHAGDVRALAEKQHGRRQRVTDGVSRSMSRPNEWRSKYEESNTANLAAAHRIGQLEQQIEQLQQEIQRRPSPEAHAELQGKFAQLQEQWLLTQQDELQEPQQPTQTQQPGNVPKWWKFWKK